jgi:molecular chaperone GrpE
MIRVDNIEEMQDKNVKREIPVRFDDEEAPEAAWDQERGKSSDIELAVEETSADDVADVDPSADDQDAVARLQAQVDELTAERGSLYDRLLRRQAEFENYRKRVERERSALYQHGRDDVVLQLLPVLDNFERALSSLESSEGDAEALRHGIELIHKQFKDALSKFGLEPVEAVGKTFDPHIHEAVTTEATDEHKENTVIEEFQRGYKIGNRLLRPAKVKVASSPEK